MGGVDTTMHRIRLVLVQYSRPGEKDFKYVHCVQGYMSEGNAHLGYTADRSG